MARHAPETAHYRPGGRAGCSECAGRDDGLACDRCFRRWRDHGRPAVIPPPQPHGQRPGVNALFWRWLEMDHRRTQADLALELGVARRTLTRWAHKRDRLIADGKLDPPPPPPPRPRSLKLSDSRYGPYGANPAAGYRAPGGPQIAALIAAQLGQLEAAS